MHELSLCGSVPAERHDRLVKQLAGVACMQPRQFEEIHLVYKARIPEGLTRLEGAGSAQTLQQQGQDVQKVKNMLQSGIYFSQLVGKLVENGEAQSSQDSTDTIMRDEDFQKPLGERRVEWTWEFKDSPETGPLTTNTRLVSRIGIQDGEIASFMELLGYDYVHRYYLEGQKFYTQDTTLALQRVRHLPALRTDELPTDWSKLPPPHELEFLDATGAYMLEASIHIIDGKVQDLRDRATRQLMSLRETLRQAVKLEKPDRLPLDTRIPIRIRPT